MKCGAEAIQWGKYAGPGHSLLCTYGGYRQARVQLELSDRGSWGPSTIVRVDRRSVEKDPALGTLRMMGHHGHVT